MDNLGKLGSDKVTGFKGTITAITHYLNDRSQYLLEAESVKGKTPEMCWVVEDRLQIIGSGVTG